MLGIQSETQPLTQPELMPVSRYTCIILTSCCASVTSVSHATHTCNSPLVIASAAVAFWLHYAGRRFGQECCPHFLLLYHVQRNDCKCAQHPGLVILDVVWSCLVINAVQVGVGALGVCQIQRVPRRKRYVWQPCLALELHPRLASHLCYLPASDHVGSIHHQEQVMFEICRVTARPQGDSAFMQVCVLECCHSHRCSA